MKRILNIAVLALAVAAGTEQKALAWSKCTFSGGVLLDCQGGGRSRTVNINRATATAPPPWAGGGMGPEASGYPAPAPAPAPAAGPTLPPPLAKPVSAESTTKAVGYTPPQNATPPAGNVANYNYGYYGYYPGYGYYGYYPGYWYGY